MNRTARDVVAEIEAEGALTLREFDYIPNEMWDDPVWVRRLAAGLTGNARALHTAARALVNEIDVEALASLMDRSTTMRSTRARNNARSDLTRYVLQRIADSRQALREYIAALAFTYPVYHRNAILQALRTGTIVFNPYSR